MNKMNQNFYFIVIIVFALCFSLVVGKSMFGSSSNDNAQMVQVYARLQMLEQSDKVKQDALERLINVTEKNATVLESTSKAIEKANLILDKTIENEGGNNAIHQQPNK